MQTQTLARVVQINVNPQGGVPKYPVESAWLLSDGVRGDKQLNRRVHGGPTRAVSLYSLEHITTLQAEGHPIAPGTTGENLTISGLDWAALTLGTRLRIGPQVELEITSYAMPCETIEDSFQEHRFVRISQKLHPGWSRLYARVLVEGEVFPGDLVALIPPADGVKG